VAFSSLAANLHPDDSDSFFDVFLRDLLTNETLLVSRASGTNGEKGNWHSGGPVISADGQIVAFTSAASNLHPNDGHGGLDVFL
jgi:hypothetical protein